MSHIPTADKPAGSAQGVPAYPQQLPHYPPPPPGNMPYAAPSGPAPTYAGPPAGAPAHWVPPQPVPGMLLIAQQWYCAPACLMQRAEQRSALRMLHAPDSGGFLHKLRLDKQLQLVTLAWMLWSHPAAADPRAGMHAGLFAAGIRVGPPKVAPVPGYQLLEYRVEQVRLCEHFGRLPDAGSAGNAGYACAVFAADTIDRPRRQQRALQHPWFSSTKLLALQKW